MYIQYKHFVRYDHRQDSWIKDVVVPPAGFDPITFPWPRKYINIENIQEDLNDKNRFIYRDYFLSDRRGSYNIHVLEPQQNDIKKNDSWFTKVIATNSNDPALFPWNKTRQIFEEEEKGNYLIKRLEVLFDFYFLIRKDCLIFNEETNGYQVERDDSWIFENLPAVVIFDPNTYSWRRASSFVIDEVFSQYEYELRNDADWIFENLPSGILQSSDYYLTFKIRRKLR
jgi:hypothetical protein